MTRNFVASVNIICLFVFFTCGCGGSSGSNAPTANAPSTNSGSPQATPADAATDTPASPETPKSSDRAATNGAAKPAAEQPQTAASKPAEVDTAAAGPPATIDEAAKVIDLRTIKLPGNPKDPPSRCLAHVNYVTPGKTQDLFEQLKKVLVEAGWKELPGGYSSEQSANGSFTRSGFVLSASVIPSGQNDEVNVSIFNHGNVSAQSLPVPEGAKQLYSFPVSSSYLTDLPVAEAKQAVSKALLEKGWVPYGEAGDSNYYKQNAIKLSATVSAAPAQEGKTMIQYSSMLMSADIPLPPDAGSAQFSDLPAQLSFDTAASHDDVSKFYRETLAKSGWKATTDNFVKIDWKNFVIFRNDKKDLIDVQLTTVDDKTRALVRFQTAAEVEAEEQAMKAELARRKKEADKPKPKVTIELPADAEKVDLKPSGIELTLPVGKAKAAVTQIQKQLVDGGWQVQDSTLEAMFGLVSLKKGDQTISINYIESGVLPPEVTISGIGVEFDTPKKQ